MASPQRRAALSAVEWTVTILFTVEYVLRLLVVQRPRRYALSALGIVDLVALLPTWLGFIYPGVSALAFLRAVRLARIFRLLQLGDMADEGWNLAAALWRARHKISVFFLGVAFLVVIQGAVLYFLEGERNPQFSSIPKSVYWAIVTVTTVGYGDISPATPLGQTIAALLMLVGYAIIAVPTGIITAQLQAGAGPSSDSVGAPMPGGQGSRMPWEASCDRPAGPD